MSTENEEDIFLDISFKAKRVVNGFKEEVIRCSEYHDLIDEGDYSEELEVLLYTIGHIGWEGEKHYEYKTAILKEIEELDHDLLEDVLRIELSYECCKMVYIEHLKKSGSQDYSAYLLDKLSEFMGKTEAIELFGEELTIGRLYAEDCVYTLAEDIL